MYTFLLTRQLASRIVHWIRPLGRDLDLTAVRSAPEACKPSTRRRQKWSAPRPVWLVAAVMACVPAAALAQSATMSDPAPGSTFSGSSATFTWSAGTGVSEYSLFVGTQGAGSKNLYASSPGSSRSATVSDLPKDGLKVYVQLNSLIDGAWHHVEYTYTEAGKPVAPVMQSPQPGAVLPGSSVTFTWSAGLGPSAYRLRLGSSGADSSNLYKSGSTAATSVTVQNLPDNGTTLYAELSWLMDTTWYSANYTYTAAGGAAAVSGLSCASSSMTGSGTDTCTVNLSAAAGSSGVAISLASNNSAIAVPASITAAAGATSVSFSADASAVSSTETVTLTASAGGASKTFAIQLNAYVAQLALNASSIAFGDVDVNSSATQTLTLTSSGTAPVTVNSDAVSGAGFSSTGASFPLTLAPKQTANLSVEFEPTSAGAASGTLTISSNSSSSPTATVALTGTGESATSYNVNLSWSAPSSSPDPVAGYNVYRALSGSSSYELMGSVSSSEFSYTDGNGIQNGETYDYIVESVDSSGNESVPSNMASIAIP